MATTTTKNGNGNGGKNGNGNGGSKERAPNAPFREGHIVHVWKLTGVKDLSRGVQTSERPQGDTGKYPDTRLKCAPGIPGASVASGHHRRPTLHAGPMSDTPIS